MSKIILVDDEAAVRKSTEQALQLADLDVESFADARKALEELEYDADLVVVSDIRMPGMDGLEFMQQVLQIDPDLPFILISGHADVATAVRAIRDGAYDLLEKPFAMTTLIDVVNRAIDKRRLTLENRQLREQLANQSRPGPRIIGKAPSIDRLRRMIGKIADSDTDVLVIGETGTGKELVARSLHEQSSRRGRNFVAINCGSIQQQLLDSELFGHEAGAFTDAKRRRVGKFEHADGGSLFLDEIESMSLATQAPLLRVLQERKIERLGSNELIPVDLRVITASKIDLRDAVEQQAFREDLYYRLNVVTLELPPLRERREDIPLLFQHFVLIAAARCESEVPPLDDRTLHALMGHDWPGNIRELRNIAERYVLLGEEMNFDLSAIIQADEQKGGTPLPKQVACFEKALIEQALTRSRGNLKEAMKTLGLPRKTLSDKMRKYGLERRHYTSG
ncbi:MAG: sigma-54 dependent transcriptional regulator [Gammaproteobacteria bacterium]|jgi:two-component system, NtrC family, C4-dicarboxylate transport response regulator DctD